jgi:hypothetical protein
VSFFCLSPASYVTDTTFSFIRSPDGTVAWKRLGRALVRKKKVWMYGCMGGSKLTIKK